jgi:hypothetical protein
MKLTILFEAENDAGEFIPVTLKMAKKLLESGTHYTESKTFGCEFLQPNEVMMFTLQKEKFERDDE